jgi:hypothetical protein
MAGGIIEIQQGRETRAAANKARRLCLVQGRRSIHEPEVGRKFLKSTVHVPAHWRKYMRIRVVVSLAVLLLMFGIAATSSVRAADDPNNGTWKINLEKSKYNPGPAPKSGTITIKIENGTETYSSEGMDASGKATNASFTAKTDGTDSPTTGNPYGDTISIKHPSLTRLVATIKKGGKVTVTVHIVVSADGKTRTATYSGKTADGKEIHDVVVYDKQ